MNMLIWLSPSTHLLYCCLHVQILVDTHLSTNVAVISCHQHKYHHLEPPKPALEAQPTGPRQDSRVNYLPRPCITIPYPIRPRWLGTKTTPTANCRILVFPIPNQKKHPLPLFFLVSLTSIIIIFLPLLLFFLRSTHSSLHLSLFAAGKFCARRSAPYRITCYPPPKPTPDTPDRRVHNTFSHHHHTHPSSSTITPSLSNLLLSPPPPS
jgi:hypothetical protein